MSLINLTVQELLHCNSEVFWLWWVETSPKRLRKVNRHKRIDTEVEAE